MWDLIVSVPDHCLSFYFSGSPTDRKFLSQTQKINKKVVPTYRSYLFLAGNLRHKSHNYIFAWPHKAKWNKWSKPKSIGPKKKKKKTIICLLSSDHPNFLLPTLKFFFPLYYPHINLFNKILTFSDLPTLFNFSIVNTHIFFLASTVEKIGAFLQSKGVYDIYTCSRGMINWE